MAEHKLTGHLKSVQSEMWSNTIFENNRWPGYWWNFIMHWGGGRGGEGRPKMTCCDTLEGWTQKLMPDPHLEQEYSC